jgi:hypothetical protein
MKGFASIEKDGHAGELGSTGIRMGEDKYQVSRGTAQVHCTAFQGCSYGRVVGWSCAAAKEQAGRKAESKKQLRLG